MTDASDGSIRIGTAEREAAIAALGDHLSAGRLDIDEYADRSAQASLARTRDELVGLFADLPEPHPRFAGPAGGMADQPTTVEDAARRTRQPVRYGPPLAARALLAMPLLALLLVLAFHLWFLFLLIPLSGALFRSRGMAGPYRRYRGYGRGCRVGWY